MAPTAAIRALRLKAPGPFSRASAELVFGIAVVLGFVDVGTGMFCNTSIIAPVESVEELVNISRADFEERFPNATAVDVGIESGPGLQEVQVCDMVGKRRRLEEVEKMFEDGGCTMYMDEQQQGKLDIEMCECACKGGKDLFATDLVTIQKGHDLCDAIVCVQEEDLCKIPVDASNQRDLLAAKGEECGARETRDGATADSATGLFQTQQPGLAAMLFSLHFIL